MLSTSSASDGLATQDNLNTSVSSNFVRATASPLEISFQDTTNLSLETLDQAVQKVEHYLNAFASSPDFS